MKTPYYDKKITVLRNGKPRTYLVRITARQHADDPTTAKITDAIDNAQRFGKPEDMLPIVDNLLRHARKYIRTAR